MRVSAVLLTHNEAELLKDWIVAVNEWADEVIVGIDDCTDNSVKIIEDFKNDTNRKVCDIKIVFVPKNTVFNDGFSIARNFVASFATGEWIVTLDTDEEMEFTRGQLEAVITAAGDKKAIRTKTWSPSPREPGEDMQSLSRGELLARMQFDCDHWRIYRNNSHVWWDGQIHEELRWGPYHIGEHAHNSEIRMLHFGCMTQFKDRDRSERLYAHLICRAIDNPELRRGTNPYWFDVFYPQHHVRLRRLQSEFQQRYLLPPG